MPAEDLTAAAWSPQRQATAVGAPRLLDADLRRRAREIRAAVAAGRDGADQGHHEDPHSFASPRAKMLATKFSTSVADSSSYPKFLISRPRTTSIFSCVSLSTTDETSVLSL